MIDTSLVDRFRADLRRLTEAPTPAARLGVAVSGGSDSLALLLLGHAAYPGAIAVATADHGLRAEAAAEADLVAGLCDRLGVPHSVLRLPPRRDADVANLQRWARAGRYRALAAWANATGCLHLATAHHRDDVAESFLMRAARGSGVRTLAAMPDTRALDGGALLIRPLLGWSRAELAGVVEAAGTTPCQDPSNDDDRFDRVRVRKLLATAPDLPPDQLARTATNLRDVEDAMEWVMARDLPLRLREHGDDLTLDVTDLPFELQRRFVLRAIETVRQSNGVFGDWRATAVPDLARALVAGSGGTVADVQARVAAGRWLFRLAAPRRVHPNGTDGPN